MECLALITARAGSKGIPRKNLYPLAGKPLIGYSFDAAKASTKLTRTILSSDGDEIIAYAKEQGIEAPFVRPAEFSDDRASHNDVILHALEWLKQHENYKPDWLVVLQPTSPLRTAQDIDNAIELALAKDADSVKSVTVAEPHPYLAQSLDKNGHMTPFFKELSTHTRRQDMPECYVLNGAIYVVKVAAFLEHKTLSMQNCFAYVMPPERSVDIDSLLDMKFAELLLQTS
ncbi:MAG: acylneuraminate cytidylyltransferase family protein [Rickettsiales bacterium]|nr:acylneuraminate cytidylyltransferase family protein [Rickettsiales bacterium]